MRTYQTKTRTERDGTLNLQLACGVADTEMDVIVIVEPSFSNGDHVGLGDQEWRQFLAETAGSIDDPSFTRHPQGQVERREPIE